MTKISLIEEILFFYLQLQTSPKASFSSSIWRCVHCIKMVFRPPDSRKLWCRSWKNWYLWRQCWREFSCSSDTAGKMLSIFTYYVFFEKWKVLVAQLCLFVIPWTVARLLFPWGWPGRNTGDRTLYKLTFLEYKVITQVYPLLTPAKMENNSLPMKYYFSTCLYMGNVGGMEVCHKWRRH